MDAAEEQVEGAVARDQVLDVPRVGDVEVEVRLPGRTAVAAHGLEQRNEALLGEMPQLAVEAAEVRRVQPIEVGQAVAVRKHDERPVSVLVRHVLRRRGGAVLGGHGGVGGPVTELLPRVAEEDAVRVREGRAVLVGVPVREGRDDADGVEALTLAEGDGVLEAQPRPGRLGASGHAPEREAPRRCRQPRVAEQEERRAVGVRERVAVRRGSHEAAPVGILLPLDFGPGNRAQLPAAAIQPGVARLVGSRPPAPLAGSRGDEADLERALAVPEPVHAPREARAFEVDPDDDLRVGIRVRRGRAQRDFLQLPDVRFATKQRRAPHDGLR